jgi:hypothetical protein
MGKYRVIVILFALGLISCASNQVPLDDAYYWPDKSAVSSNTPTTTTTTTQTTHTVQTVQTESNSVKQQAPSVEFISVKDTTVTVKIKR